MLSTIRHSVGACRVCMLFLSVVLLGVVPLGVVLLGEVAKARSTDAVDHQTLTTVGIEEPDYYLVVSRYNSKSRTISKAKIFRDSPYK